jgi:hypothetical protein
MGGDDQNEKCKSSLQSTSEVQNGGEAVTQRVAQLNSDWTTVSRASDIRDTLYVTTA